jgi:Flp pilus assembly protein TadG
MMLKDAILRFAESRSANFAIIAGLTAVPLMLMMGGAVDISRLRQAEGTAQQAAEAAALAAALRLEFGTVAEAQADIQGFGAANLNGAAGVSFSETIDLVNGTVTVTAKGSVEPTFLKLAQIDTLDFERKATVNLKQKRYVELRFLLDISESMNIGASDADRDKLRATTAKENNRACAFACHVWEDLQYPYNTPYSVYQMNQSAGVNKARLRIDVVREASSAMIRKLLAKNKDPKALISVAIKTGTFNYEFVPRFGPSDDENQLIASIDGSTIAQGGTDFNKSLADFAEDLGTQGDGRTKDTPVKIALMITDGVRDSNGHGPLIPSPACSQVKDKKIDFAVLEIKHVWDRDPYGFFDYRVMPFYDDISPNLAKCASNGLYDLATDADQSAEKILTLIDKLLVRKMVVAR